MNFSKTVDNEHGQRQEQVIGDFKGERFPGTTQSLRIIYNSSMGRYPAGNLTSDQLNDLVKQCYFINDIFDHPERGKPITTTNPADPFDPFFRNKDAKITMSEGEYRISGTKPFEKIFLEYMNEHYDFVTANTTNPIFSKRARYKVINTDILSVAKKETRNKKIEATNLFSNLTSEKRLKIALIMGLVPVGTTDPELVDETLFNACLDDAKFDKDSELSRQDLFIQLCNVTSEIIFVKHMIALAKQNGLLKGGPKSGYSLFGGRIGNTMLEVEKYFADTENQDTVNKIQEAIKGRK